MSEYWHLNEQGRIMTTLDHRVAASGPIYKHPTDHKMDQPWARGGSCIVQQCLECDHVRGLRVMIDPNVKDGWRLEVS